MAQQELGNQGQFITVEGIEGVGKSTNVDFISQWVRAQGHEVVVTREPGGTRLAEKLRGLLLEHHQENITPQTELMLLFAGRSQHLAEVIKPALKTGKWVVCDRFTDATYAYQGAGRGISLSDIARLEELVQSDLQPNVTFLLDCELSISIERLRARASKKDRIEQESLDFFQRVRDGYLARLSAHQARMIRIDAGGTLDEVQLALQHSLESRFA